MKNEKVLFDRLEDALGEVATGDARQLLMVKFKAKDYYALAESEDEAMAAVMRKLGADSGAVPLDLILAAHAAKLGGKAASGVVAPPQLPEKIKLSTLGVAELKQIHRARVLGKDNVADTSGLKRAELVGDIARHLGDEYADDKMEAVAADPAGK